MVGLSGEGWVFALQSLHVGSICSLSSHCQTQTFCASVNTISLPANSSFHMDTETSLAATFYPQRKRTHLPKYYFWHDYFFSKVPRQVASYAYLRKCSWDCYLAYFSFCMLMPTHMCMRERGSEQVLGDVCTLALFPIIIARHFCFAKWEREREREQASCAVYETVSVWVRLRECVCVCLLPLPPPSPLSLSLTRPRMFSTRMIE